MIIRTNGKNIAFGLLWKSNLSGGDLHREARSAKAKYFWSEEKAVHYGLMSEADSKKKFKGPIYAGAIAILNHYSDTPNLFAVLDVTDEAEDRTDGCFVVCGIHRSRPRAEFDVVVETPDEVVALLTKFKELCGTEGFELYGDVNIAGIIDASLDDIAQGISKRAVLKRARGASGPKIIALATVCAVAGAGWYGYDQHQKDIKLKMQMAMAQTAKTASDIYQEDLALRRKENVFLARDIASLLAHVRAVHLSKGGWPLDRISCNLTTEKQATCLFEYKLQPDGAGTFETFVAAAGDLDDLQFSANKVSGTMSIKDLPFVEMGSVLEAARSPREEVIEFGSSLQRSRKFATTKLGDFAPYALPPGVGAAELDKPPYMVASWEFSAPVRGITQLRGIPPYAYVKSLSVVFGDQPIYDAKQSLAMLAVSGQVIAKPN